MYIQYRKICGHFDPTMAYNEPSRSEMDLLVDECTTEGFGVFQRQQGECQVLTISLMSSICQCYRTKYPTNTSSPFFKRT